MKQPDLSSDSLPPAEVEALRERAARSVDALQALLMLCIAVPLLLFMGFAIYRYQQMLADAEVRLTRSLAIAHEHALRVLDLNDALLQQALDLGRDADDIMLLAARNDLRQRLQAMVEGKPHVRFLRMLDAHGGSLATAGREPELDTAAAASLREQMTQAPDALHVSAMLGDDANGRWFELSRLLRTDDGQLRALVTVGMDRAYLTRYHQQLSAEEPGLAITVFRSDGVVFSRWPAVNGADVPARMSPQGEVLSRVLRGESNGTVRNVSSLDGQRRIILFRKLGAYPIYIGTGREFNAIRAELLHELLLLGAVAVVPLLGLVMTAWIAARRTHEALRALRRLAKETTARRTVEEALLQSQKMEALGRLTGGVAHDFNNALMVISGNIHLLRHAQPHLPTRHFDAMHRAIESATQLTRQLLAFSRRQALAPQTLSLQDWLPPIKDLLAPTLGSQVQLDVAVAADTPPLHVDPAELELALINLAVNARDAMPDGGTFHVRAWGETERGPTGQPRTWVVIEASDSGTGMDAETLQKALDPFFTTKPVGKGTGLGLSQVHALCQRAGGDTHLRSQPGVGTTVSMRFPASTAQPAHALPARPSGLPSGVRVLLAEDNAHVAAVVRPVLEDLGCTVEHVASAPAALQRLEQEADAFDLLLSDVVMPGELDGASLAHRARERWPRLRVLLMTGYAEQIQAIAAMKLDVLPKPFTPQALADAIGKAMRAQETEDAAAAAH